MLNLFFQNSTAEFLQQIAIFFEVSGLSLVVLDIFYPDHANRLEEGIDRIMVKSHDSIARGLEGYFQMAVLPILILTFYILVKIGIIGEPENPDAWRGAIVIIAIFVLFVALLFLWALIFTVSVAFFSVSIKYLDKIANGKALAGLGLILASVGAICEFYQVVTLCVWQGCYGIAAF